MEKLADTERHRYHVWVAPTRALAGGRFVLGIRGDLCPFSFLEGEEGALLRKGTVTRWLRVNNVQELFTGVRSAGTWGVRTDPTA